MSQSSVDSERHDRRLSAILAADVVGYSRLMGADEDGTLQALKAHRKAVVDPAIASHRGRIVKTTGDGMLVEFASAVDAVRSAVDVQRGMAERNQGVPRERRLEYRIGINVGDIIGDGEDIYGDGVNVAARLEAMAEPGGIYVSRAVRDPVRDKLAFGFDDLGESFTDEVQKRLERKLRELTGGEMAKPIVAVGWNAAFPDGYNIALRIRHAGYTNVYWYRGGREAWEVAGKPEEVVRPTEF